MYCVGANPSSTYYVRKNSSKFKLNKPNIFCKNSKQNRAPILHNMHLREVRNKTLHS